MDNLDHELAGLDGVDDILTEGLGLDIVGKLFCDLEIDVGLKQGTAYILEGFCNVYLGDFAFTFQYFEASLEPFT